MYHKLFCRKMITNWFGDGVQKRPKPEGNTWTDDVWNECEKNASRLSRNASVVEEHVLSPKLAPWPVKSLSPKVSP